MDQHYLWRGVLDSEACTTARDYHIHGIFGICPALDKSLNVKDAVWHNIEGPDMPLAGAIFVEHIFEYVAAFVARRVFCGGLGDDQNSCFELRHSSDVRCVIG